MNEHRLNLKSDILGILSNNTGKCVPQHIMLVGSVAGGKSFFLNTLYEELKNSEKYITIVRSPYYAISTASFFISKADKSQIILADDFDVYLSQLSLKEKYKLREYLFSDDAPALVGTVSGVVKDFYDYRSPFYDAFRMFRLNDPDAEYINNMASDICGRTVSDIDEARPFFGLNLYYWNDYFKMRQNHQLTFADAVNFIMERNSRYFKLLIDSQPYLNKVAIMGIVHNQNKATANDIQKGTDIPLASVSTTLRRLTEKGIVGKTDKNTRRNIFYKISDTLLYRWLLHNTKSCNRGEI